MLTLCSVTHNSAFLVLSFSVCPIVKPKKNIQAPGWLLVRVQQMCSEWMNKGRNTNVPLQDIWDIHLNKSETFPQ